LATYKGWAEGKAYFGSFIKNEICGRMLKNLNMDLLEFDLGIANMAHRKEIFSTILRLFPTELATNKTPTPVIRSSIVSIARPESDCSTFGGIQHAVVSGNESTSGQYPISIYSSYESMQMDYCDFKSDSCYSKSSLRTGTESEEKVLIRGCRSNIGLVRPKPLRQKKLYLLCNVHTVRDVNVIRNRFLEFNFIVNVRPSGKNYIIEFETCMQAKQALQLAKKIRYRLVMRPRATPSTPTNYICLVRCTIRIGKSLYGEVVGKLLEGDIVTVNQLKGRRARIIRVHKNGDVSNVGWVTVKTMEGVELLKQLDEV